MTTELDDTRRLVDEAFAAALAPPEPAFRRRVARALAAERTAGGARGGRGWTFGRRRLALGATIAILAVLATAVALPATRTALARATGLGFLGSLFGAPAGEQASLAEATTNGYAVRIVGAYDDGTTVALAFQVRQASPAVPAIDDGWPLHVTATDSTGHEMAGKFTPVKEALDTNVQAFTRPVGGSPAGTPITIRVTQIQRRGGGFSRGFATLGGRWTLHLTITPSSPTHELAHPAPGQLGAATVSFVSVRANDAYLHVQLDIRGISCTGGKGGCGPDVQVYGPDGRRLTMLNWSTLQGTSDSSEWQLSDHGGTYRIVLTAGDGTTLERTIDVPYARSGSVPEVTPRS